LIQRVRWFGGLTCVFAEENAERKMQRRKIVRCGCAFTPAFGRAEAPFGAGVCGRAEALPFLLTPSSGGCRPRWTGAGDGQLAKGEAEALGGVVVVEAREVEFGLLAGDGGEVFGDCRGRCSLWPLIGYEPDVRG
jgi:hypothetical protein